MPAQWIFRETMPGYKNRQPNNSEFFSTDAIKSNTEALVRESIQNSLDALRDTETSVHVHFHLAQGTEALTAEKGQEYFGESWEHFTARENGLDDVPAKNERCPFLVIEDFNTTGLIGDIGQWQYEPEIRNPFFFFFRAEGLSSKTAEELGRWGIGKYVFPRSSRVRSFLAYTVRFDDHQQLLLGQTILKSHKVNGKHYTPDADYGQKDSTIPQLVLPVNDSKLITAFISDFHLKRSIEPGLSIVVPWIDPDLTKESLVKAIIENFFHSILIKGLKVTVASGTQEIEISKDTINSVCEQFGEDYRNQMFPLFSMVEWEREHGNTDTITINPANSSRPEWTREMIPENRLQELREKFRSGNIMGLKVPVTVRAKKKAAQESWFKMYIHNNGNQQGNPIFVRTGNIISDVRGLKVSGVSSLVVVTDAPLSQLLGDSENPAHTEWEKDGSNFKNKYVYGPSYISFMKQSVSSFIRLLNETDEQPDKDLLGDIFFISNKSDDDAPKEKSQPRKKNIGEVIPSKPETEPVQRRYAISRIAGGFSVTPNRSDLSINSTMKILVAYDRRRGNPFKKYDRADFQVGTDPIKIITEGVEILTCEQNKLDIKIINSDFRITAKGFDENRDLLVNVIVKEADNETQA